MRSLIPAGLISLLSAVSQAVPTQILTSVDGVKFTTGPLVHTVDIVQDGVTKTVEFYGYIPDTVAKRQLYINGNEGMHFDKCGSSTFTNKTSAFSPTVSDCQCIVSGVTQQGGYFFARPVDGLSVGVQLIKCNSCAFTISSSDTYGSEIGDTDISDVISSSINQFQAPFQGTPLVSATGTMPCNNDEDEAQTTWTIVHVAN